MTKQMTVPVVLAVLLALASSMALAKQHRQTVSDEQVRNWSQFDTNHDNLIEPQEMEKCLAANPGPLKK